MGQQSRRRRKYMQCVGSNHPQIHFFHVRKLEILTSHLNANPVKVYILDLNIIECTPICLFLCLWKGDSVILHTVVVK